MIFPTWQQIGQSSHQIARDMGAELGEPATHTGTLDPMAEGVLIILTGEDRLAKGELGDWDKLYEFSILWGVSTDSGDRLGLIEQLADVDVEVAQLEQAMTDFPTSYLQESPPYSAQRWKGKSGFDWAKQNVSMPRKQRQVGVRNWSLIDVQTESVNKVLAEHEESVSKVAGDFRQQEIVNSWQNRLSNQDNKLTISTHQVTVSTGTYIRQLAQDLASRLQVPATTWSIVRLRNGPYEQRDC